MVHPHRAARGYTMLELLVVLVIVGILAVAGVTMIGNRPTGSLRTVLDEVEGFLQGAHKLAVATGRDVALTNQGNWELANPLLMARGTGLTPTQVLAAGQTQAESFRLAVVMRDGVAVTVAREHLYAGLVAVSGTGSDWWTTAMLANPDTAKQNEDLNSVEPFKSQVGFNGLLDDPDNNLIQGGIPSAKAARATVGISGANKRFNTTFWIQVVGLKNGAAVPGGPMGLLFVQGNGAAIYKFYNPGVNNGDGKWRRI